MTDLRDDIIDVLNELAAWADTIERKDVEDAATKIMDLVKAEREIPRDMYSTLYVELPKDYLSTPATTHETSYQLCGCRVTVEAGELVLRACVKHFGKEQ